MLGFKDLYNLCAELSHSQGFYGRMLANLQELNEEQIAELDKEIKSHNFRNDLDLIYWLEC